jgi:purine-binding chemotaxis protein CheW
MKPPSRGRGRAIDWGEVRRRLERAIAATEATGTLSPEQARALLDQRARELARAPAAALRADEVLDVVAFDLAGERYAIEAHHVCEVSRLGEVARVPGAPGHLAGVLNRRGEVLPVFDLRVLLGLSTPAATERSRILVLGDARAELGVLADEVREVRRLRRAEVLEAAGTQVQGAVRQHVLGVTAAALVVLDGAALLRDPRLFIDLGEEAGA